MKKIINHLRNKPDHIKSRYVIVFSVIATALTIALWIVTMQLSKTSDDTIKTESPLKSMGQIFSGAVSDVQESYSNQKKSLNQAISQEEKIPNQPQVLPEGSGVENPPVPVSESEILREDNL